MPVKFSYEAYLLYGAVGLAVVLLFYILSAFRLAKKGQGIGFFTFLLRVVALGLLLLAVAGPFIEESLTTSRAIVALDVSDSNDAAVSESLLKTASAFRQNDLDLSIFAFADRAATLNANFSQSFRDAQLNSGINIGATNYEEAFASLQGVEPSSVVLVSDGYETRGDSQSRIKDLADKGFKIFPLIPENAESGQKGFQISQLYAPLVAPAEKSVDVRVTLNNSTSSKQSGILEVKHDGKVVYEEEVNVEAGSEAVITTQSDPSKEGIKEITATLKPKNSAFSHSSASAFLSGESREKILIVSGSSEDARFLSRVLEGQAFETKEYIGSSQAQNIGDLSQYSVVILNNIAQADLPKGAATKIESYVQGGGSFVMIGGNRSFGLGGYINSSIEDVLPVSLVPPQTVEKRLNVAVQLVIDKSGSMSENNKIDYAKEAATETVNNLKDEDYIGVMGFDTNPFVVLRMKKVSEVKYEAQRRIGLLEPHGGTSLIASIDEARRDLTRVNAGRKHLFILTDGEIKDVPESYYYGMVKDLRPLGITVSTVMLGSEANPSMLRTMADYGGGAFYQTNDPRNLPKIFISDIKVASGEKTMKEETDYAVRLGPSSERSTRIESYPHIRGYVQTKIKPKANLELVASGEDKSEPLLASWNYGKGKSVAFTSDANGRWSSDWITWSQFARFWSEIVESLRIEKKEEQEKIKFDLRNYYEKGILHLDLSVYSESATAGTEGEIILPNGDKRHVSFYSLAPGHYHATIENPLAGRYEFRGNVGKSKLTPVAFNLSGELFGEKKGQGFNLPFLRNLANSTSGKINPTIDDLRKQSYVSVKKTDLTRAAMLIAAVLLLLEIIWREVFSGRFFRFRKKKTILV